MPAQPECVFHGSSSADAFRHALDQEFENDQPPTDFRGFRFPSGVLRPFPIASDFEDAQFEPNVKFSGPLQGSFDGVRFKGRVSTSEIVGPCKITSARFDGRLFLNPYRVAEETHFRGCTFKQAVDVVAFLGPSAEPSGHIHFEDCTFHGPFTLRATDPFLLISSCELRSGGALAVHKPGGHFELDDLRLFSRFTISCVPDSIRLDLTLQAIQGAEHLRLHSIDLSQASLREVDMAAVQLSDVQWPKRIVYPRCSAVRNENEYHLGYPHGEMRLREAEGLYHGLVRNYDNLREFRRSDEFRIGEFEVRRRLLEIEKPWLRFANAYSLYRKLSRYGTSYWQALAWLMVLIVLLSSALLFAGFTVLDGAGNRQNIEYDWMWSLPEPSRIVALFFHALAFAFSVATFQRGHSYSTDGSWAALLVAIATPLLAGQIALVLLAIRRRFRIR